MSGLRNTCLDGLGTMMRTILRSRVTKLLASAAVAATMGLGLGLWLHARSEPQRILRFEQPAIDLRDSPAIEGEPINVVGKLHNHGKVPVRITNVTTCCGTKVTGPDGEEVVITKIAPGASVPVPLRISTTLVSGERLAGVQVEGQTPDGKEVAPAELVVSAYVRSPLVASPLHSTISVHQDELFSPVKQTVVLADHWPGDGLSIKSVTSTLGDKLQYQLVPARGEVWIDSRLLRKRDELELSLTIDPTKPTFDHTVTITPDHPRAKPVEIRLTGTVLPRCGLDVGSVAFCGTKQGDRLVRQVEYRYRDASDQEIRLVKAPPWLSVSITEARDGVKLVTLTCTLPECKGVRLDEASFEFGRDKQRSALTLVVSCAAAGNARVP